MELTIDYHTTIHVGIDILMAQSIFTINPRDKEIETRGGPLIHTIIEFC
jgi:hypothetical protein